jgi:hypothetical protein
MGDVRDRIEAEFENIDRVLSEIPRIDAIAGLSFLELVLIDGARNSSVSATWSRPR